MTRNRFESIKMSDTFSLVSDRQVVSRLSLIPTLARLFTFIVIVGTFISCNLVDNHPGPGEPLSAQITRRTTGKITQDDIAEKKIDHIKPQVLSNHGSDIDFLETSNEQAIKGHKRGTSWPAISEPDSHGRARWRRAASSYSYGGQSAEDPSVEKQRQKSARLRQQQQQVAHSDQPPGELMFSNQTGAVALCSIGRELERAIARTDRQQKQQPGDSVVTSKQSFYRLNAGGDQANGIHIRWEKENGEDLEQVLYATSDSPEFHQPAGQANNQRPLRYVRASDGALVFEPFKAADYRPDVHAATYRCVASSPARGASLVSRDMRVRAVVSPPGASSIQVEVLDELVLEGNSALFKCQIPAYAAAFVQPLDWIELPTEASFSVQSTSQASLAHLFPVAVATLESGQPSSQGQSGPVQTVANKVWAQQQQQQQLNASSMRYFVSPKTGDLHILNVDSSLNYRSYKCRCKNKLTGEIIGSINKGKLIVSESHSPIVPRLSYSSNQPALVSSSSLSSSSSSSFNQLNLVTQINGQQSAAYEEGELALLVCHLQAFPRPQISWFKRNTNNNDDYHDGQLESVKLSGRFAQLNNLLFIRQLERNDSGIYLCLAKNSIGEERLEMSLQVRAPLSAKMSASASVLELGKSLALECTVTGYPISQVVFRHNRNVIKSISGSSSSTSNQMDEPHKYLPVGASNRRLAYSNNQRRLPTGSGDGRMSNYFVVDSLSETRMAEGEHLAASSSDSDLVDQLDQEEQEESASSSTPVVPGQTSAGSNSRSLSHVIVIVLEPQHAGAYQCFAHNQFESVQSSAYIRVLDDPPKFRETFKSGVYEQRQDISLLCSAKANPLPEITWSLDEAPIPESARMRFGDFVTKDGLVISYVNISSIQVTDGGLYRCMADNGLAQVSHEAQVSVLGAPTIKPMPNVTVLASTTFRQRCPVAGYPIGDIQWHHNGHRLPANHRQHVHDNGTLEVEHMEKSAGDEGEYICIASPPQQQQDSSSSSGGSSTASAATNKAAYGSVQVSIRVRPTIEPFSVSRNLREGQRASIMCTISSGDLPISISWFRNDQLLLVPPQESLSSPPGLLQQQQQQQAGGQSQFQQMGAPQVGQEQQPSQASLLPSVTISRVSDYSSTLLFESLLAQHSGNYTCLARNDAGSVTHQAPMIVQVAPKWSIEPSDTNIVRGSSASIDCMASGFPPPRIIWTKASGDPPAGSSATSMDAKLAEPARPAHHLGAWVFENGSLNILDARDSDLGHYMCQASNGVGAGLSKVIRLVINVAAQFQARHSIQYVARGDQAHLKCQTKGDWPISLHWLKNKHRLEPVNQQEAPANSNQPTSATSIGGASASAVGANQHPAPTAVLSSTVSSLVVVPNSVSSSAFAGLQYQPNGNQSRHNHQANDNKHSKRHYWSVAEQLNTLLLANNGDQSGKQTDTGHLMQRYSLATSELLLSVSSTTATTTTTANNILEQLRSGSFETTQQPVLIQLSSVLSIQQAERQDTATFRCLAANHFGFDERTIQLIVQEPPDRIEEVKKHEVNSRYVTLGWQAPYDGNAPITHYHVQYRALSSSPTASNLATGSQHEQQISPETLNNLSWFNYTLSINSNTLASSGSSLSQQPSNNANIQSSASVQMPTDGNQVATGGAGSSSGGRTNVKISISSLRPMTRYWFRVEPENKLGRGPVSQVVELMTMEEAPGAAPTKLKAVAQSSSSILVSWSKLNEKDVFGSVLGYHVGYQPLPNNEPSDQQAGGRQQQVASNTTEAKSHTHQTAINTFKGVQHDDKASKFDALLVGLKRQTKYLISVQAYNAQGTGPSSEPLVVKTLDLDPPKQVKLFVKLATNCSIQLEWRPLSQAALLQHQHQQQPKTEEQQTKQVGQPVDSSFPAIDVVDYYSLYQAELNERPRWQEVRLAGHATSHTIDQLKCGTRYQFYMMGVNRIGVGDQSDILDTKTGGGLPIAPDRQSTFDVINTTCYIVRLDHWQDNSCPIRRFNIRYKLESGRDWLQLARFEFTDKSGEDQSLTANTSAGELPQASPRGSMGSSFFFDHVGNYMKSSRWRAKRSSSEQTLETTNNEAYQENESDEDDAFLDYSAAAASSSLDGTLYAQANSQADLADYLALEAASTISKSDSGGRTPRSSDDHKLFSLLKDSMLPTFDSRELSSPQLEPISTSNTLKHSTGSSGSESRQLGDLNQAIMLPQVAKDWQASNFMETTSSDIIRPDRQATTRSADQQLADKKSPGGDWRRVRLCNLMENQYYIVQLVAENSVGETEAELRILTSPEGLEYDADIKRQVVGRLGGSDGFSGDRMIHSAIAINDRLNQWPVLLPISVTLTLMTIIIIITFLLKRSSSSSSSSRSPGLSPTTTTTTTTMAGGSSGNCGSNVGYGSDIDSNHPHQHHHHLDEPHHRHHYHQPMGTFKRGAPITELATDSSDLMLGGPHGISSNVDNYASINQQAKGPCSMATNQFDMELNQEAHQNGLMYHPFNQLSADKEPAYNVVKFIGPPAGASSMNANDGSHVSSNSPTTTTTTTGLLSLAASSSTGGGGGSSNSNHQFDEFNQSIKRRGGSNVFLCSNSKPGSDSKQQDQPVCYRMTSVNPHQATSALYGHQVQMIRQDHLTDHRQVYNEPELSNNIEGANSLSVKLANGQDNNCFMNIVDEVTRAANDDHLNSVKAQLLQNEQCNQLHCQFNSYRTLQPNQHHHSHQPAAGLMASYAPPDHDQTSIKHQAMPNGGTGGGGGGGLADQMTPAANGAPAPDQLMFDPVYATIRRTFPQAFRYLTLQHNNHCHQNQQLLQEVQRSLQLQQANGQQMLPTVGGNITVGQDDNQQAITHNQC